MLRQTSNAAINFIAARAMHPLAALLSDLKVISSTAKLALRGDQLACNWSRADAAL